MCLLILHIRHLLSFRVGLWLFCLHLAALWLFLHLLVQFAMLLLDCHHFAGFLFVFVYFVMGFYGVTCLILDSLWSFRIYLGYFLYFVLPFMFCGHVALCSTI